MKMGGYLWQSIDDGKEMKDGEVLHLTMLSVEIQYW
jgi:hypothetical protein